MEWGKRDVVKVKGGSPEKPNLYWWRLEKGEVEFMVDVYMSIKEKKPIEHIAKFPNFTLNIKGLDGEWAGPVERPVEQGLRILPKE